MRHRLIGGQQQFGYQEVFRNPLRPLSLVSYPARDGRFVAYVEADECGLHGSLCLRVFQRRNALATCLAVRGLTSPPICEALALDAFRSDLGAVHAADAASVVSKVEFADVTLQVSGRDVVIGADDPALTRD
jgi:hypothetical protein